MRQNSKHCCLPLINLRVIYFKTFYSYHLLNYLFYVRIKLVKMDRIWPNVNLKSNFKRGHHLNVRAITYTIATCHNSTGTLHFEHGSL